MVKIKKGTELKASDGNNYRWLGAQWGKIGKSGKTGISAKKRISVELSKKYEKKNPGLKQIKSKKDTKSKDKSINWFTKQVEKSTEHFTEVAKPKIGGMYTYIYDAKHKATLPYWDKYPLIIMVKPYKDGFLGLNFHYLSPANRDRFFTAMLKFTGKKDPADLTEKDIFNINWNKVSSVPFVEKTVHRYLFSHIKTKLVEIGPHEWEDSIYLPTAQFKGASQKQVWSS